MLIVRWVAVAVATLVLVLIALDLPGSLSTQAAPSCAATPARGTLRANITEHATTTEVRFTNRSNTCSYPIGLAVYRAPDGNIDHQQLYDYRLAVIPPHSTLSLVVNNPTCAFQSDAFYGPLLASFAGGVRYDRRRLADDFGNAGVPCPVNLTATPTLPPPPPTAPPTLPPPPPTATPTLPPPPPTSGPVKVQAKNAAASGSR